MEDVAQVVVDGVGAQEHRRPDLGVGAARGREARDGELLGGEVERVAHAGRGGLVADGGELGAGPVGEGRSLSALEEVECRVELLPSVAADLRGGIEEHLAEQLPEAACVLVVSSRPGSDHASPRSAPDQQIGPLADEHTVCVASPEFATLYSLE